MKKRKKTSKKKKTFFSAKLIIIILTIIIFSLASFIGGFLLNENRSKKEIQKYKNTLLTLQEKVNKLSKQLNEEKIHTKKPIKHTKYTNSEIIDLLSSSKKEKPPKITLHVNKKINNIKKPKLVIIIDDVAFKHEVKMIKQIPFHITPSFFPPTKNHPYTPLYAKNFPVYMVHVPMQAIHYAHPEPNTMNTDWNYWQIKQRIEKIKNDFPKVKFINNHTGSTFTSNYKSMNLLFNVLKEENLGFVDSKTTPYSKSTLAEKNYHIPLFSRDIFLDNIENSSYIRNQLKKAVKIAKKRGYAIAIGHPHKVTLITLKNSADILKDVDVIYINELKKYAKN